MTLTEPPDRGIPGASVRDCRIPPPPVSAPRFAGRERLALLGITALAALPRIHLLLTRIYRGDEVGTLGLLDRSYGHLLTHFSGHLTMNYFIALTKPISAALGREPAVLGLVPCIAGIATVPLTAVLARRFCSPRVALLAALLAACNPYLIDFSPVVRSYSLLAFFSLLTLIPYFWWTGERTVRRGILFSVSAFLLLLTHLTGVYTLAFVLLLFLLDSARRIRSPSSLRQQATLVLPGMACILLLIPCYRGLLPDIRAFSGLWQDTPPADVSRILLALRYQFQAGWLLVPTVFFLLYAAWFICWRHRRSAVLLAFPVVTVALVSFQGMSHFPWAYARFLIFCVPVLIILLSEGICNLPPRVRSARAARTLPALLALLLLSSWAPRLGEICARERNLPWRDAGAFIRTGVGPDCQVVGLSWAVRFQLLPYLPADRAMSLEDYLVQPDTGGPVCLCTVFALPGDRPLKSTLHRFGWIRVCEYRAADRNSALQDVLRDLGTLTQGEADPALADLYEQMFGICQALGDDGRAHANRELHLKCLARTDRERYLPPQPGR